MRIYTCEKCLNHDVVCEVTVRDDIPAPRVCPYGIESPQYTSYKEGKDAVSQDQRFHATEDLSGMQILP